MNIMVFDVPAEGGGALTILKQYYEKAVNDKNNKWFFVISTPDLVETDNIKVMKYPWVKKSWFHRLYFDTFVAHKIVGRYKINEVLSLQNVLVRKLKIKQTLYLHQPLPFIKKRYRMTENIKFWVYQNLICKMIFSSIKKADKVIVQTKWMKDTCIKIVGVDSNKFEIKQPELNIDVKKFYEQEDAEKKLFIYPASGMIYKNHCIITEALKKLKKQNISNYRVLFTLNGNENKNVEKLYKLVNEYNLPVEFIGQISLEEVYDYYSKSILIFPSYIETFGLPLLEAKMHGSPILASDCDFSHEILDGYKYAYFFNPFDSNELFNYMKKLLVVSSDSVD